MVEPDGGTILEFDGISRSFFGVPVLKDVGLSLGRGRILGLVGENGAGKSTLMNILGGVLPPDSGRMRLGGAEYAPGDPAEATARGVAFIHQELNLFTNLSIAENLFINGFPRVGPFIDRRRAADRAREALKAVDLGRNSPPAMPQLADIAGLAPARSGIPGTPPTGR